VRPDPSACRSLYNAGWFLTSHLYSFPDPQGKKGFFCASSFWNVPYLKSGLALKNPPKKTHPKKTQKNPPKKTH
jgi:hypothetical protein